MSWEDRILKAYTITTGDGRFFNVHWRNPSKSLEFNISEFNFPEVEGTLVDRRKPKGRKFPIEIYFQGNGEGRQSILDHLDEADQFEISSRDNRPWRVDHPYYGIIICQPVSLNFSNESENITKITGTLIETITNTPAATTDPVDSIRFQKEQLDEFTSLSFSTNIPIPSTLVVNRLNVNTTSIYNEGKRRIKSTVDAESYLNLFNEANAAIINATNKPFEAINAIQTMINAPFNFEDSVKNRLAMLYAQYATLVNGVAVIVTLDDKKVYENNSVSLLSAMALASVTNPDYANRVEVVSTIDSLVDQYNQLITDLDSLQSENGGNEDSYIPDAESLLKLSDLINFTISNLFQVSLTTKQERILYLEEDSNLILLAHRLYGLTPDDSTITRLINDNGIGLNEMLVIRKDRKIVYYV